MKLLQNFSYKFKIQSYRRYLNVSRILSHKYKAVVKVSRIAKQTVSRK